MKDRKIVKLTTKNLSFSGLEKIFINHVFDKLVTYMKNI